MNDPFESARPRLIGRAYRILGSFADADDVVQDAWLRWDAADRDSVERPDAWLNTVVTRLAIDRLRRRTRDQERYVGPWLPTPIVERAADPADVAELAESMTSAFLIMLEELSPDERVAFLLADVFGEEYDTIAELLDRSPEACRQLASRGRRKARATERPHRDDRGEAGRIADRFVAAIASGDEPAAVACLAPDAVFLSDGGPNQRAARRPIDDPRRIVRLLTNLWQRSTTGSRAVPALVGGLPGLVVEHDRGLYGVANFEIADGRIVRVTMLSNPDKLAVGLERARITVE